MQPLPPRPRKRTIRAKNNGIEKPILLYVPIREKVFGALRKRGRSKRKIKKYSSAEKARAQAAAIINRNLEKSPQMPLCCLRGFFALFSGGKTMYNRSSMCRKNTNVRRGTET